MSARVLLVVFFPPYSTACSLSPSLSRRIPHHRRTPAPQLIRAGWLAEPADCVRQNNWFTIKCKSVILNNEVWGSGTNWRPDSEHEEEGGAGGVGVVRSEYGASEGRRGRRLLICIVTQSEYEESLFLG